jgi:hypothetical protein
VTWHRFGSLRRPARAQAGCTGKRASPGSGDTETEGFGCKTSASDSLDFIFQCDTTWSEEELTVVGD